MKTTTAIAFGIGSVIAITTIKAMGIGQVKKGTEVLKNKIIKMLDN